MSLFRPQLNTELADPESKRKLNRFMFDIIAPKYHITTRALSLGRDEVWKNELISGLDAEKPLVCLDLATGPGDLAVLLAQRYPEARIVGLDLSEEMIAIAKRNHEEKGFEFHCGDICELPFEDGFADVVTGGYALRNVPDLDLALREINRVLKPGGVAGFLDFVNSSSPFRRVLHQGMLHFWGGLCGLIMHGRPWIYQYIPASLARFPKEDDLRERIAKAGFEVTGGKRYFLGLMETLRLRKVS